MRRLAVLYFILSYYSLSGQSLFTNLSAAQTGVTFQNTITDEKAHNILIYSNYYGGGGVGIGDFNQDGLADLFFAGNQVGDQLYLNKGNLQFENITQKAGILNNGGWSSGVVLADVNNDGKLDIYVTRELYDDQPELRKNALYINTTAAKSNQLSFVESAAEYGINNSERTRHATFLDYNQDGFLDLFLLNQPPNPGNYSPLFGSNLKQEKWMPRLYKNTGKGQFEDVTKTAGLLQAGYTNSVIAADINKDGWTDLYVTNDYEAPDWLYLNNGDGTFTDVLKDQLRHISYYSMGVDAADINNDGWLDIMTLDMVAEDNFRLKANMGGMYPEAFWKLVNQGGHYQYMFNALHLNNGNTTTTNGTFSDIAQMAGVSSTDWSWANLIADFDNDGYKDIYVTNGLLRDIRNSDAAKEFPKYVQKTIDDFIKANPNAGTVGIFDILDLDKALALIPSTPLANYAFKNNGDLTFSKTAKEWGLDAKTFSNGAAYGDLDNDGDLDLVVNNINEVAHIYQNNSNNTSDNNYLRVEIHNKDQPTFGVKIKVQFVDAWQMIELANVRGMYSTSENIAHFGLGQQQITNVMVEWPNGEQFFYPNVTANQTLKVARTKYNLTVPKEPLKKPLFTSANPINFQHQENDFNDYAKQVLLPHKQSQFGPALAKGDLNGDGLEDVFVGGAVGQAGQFFIQTTNGQFVGLPAPSLQADAAYEDVAATFFDADNDGDLDLYIVSGGNEFVPQSKMYQDRLYLNDGHGSIKKTTTQLPKFRDSGACVKPFDYDNDGDLDLFVGGRHIPWAYPSPAISRLLQNNDGVFTDITNKKAKDLIYSGMVTDATWTDFNQDGQTDLILVGEWMSITFLENKNGNLTKTEQSIINASDDQPIDHTGWWYSLHANDFDGDGDDDYVVGNLGLNAKYKASQIAPFEVHYDDFDNNGKKDIVLSYYNFGEQYPLRGRSCSAEQIPEIKEKFGSYNIFASSNLSTIYTPNALEKALHYSAKTFASVYIENKGNGIFSLKALPQAAQVSSVNSILSNDYNEDGHLDLLIAGNLYPAEIETPRNDGGIGLLLYGNGKGDFKPVAPLESGISLPYDVKQMLPVATPKGELIIIGNNDEKVLGLWKK